MSFETQEIQSWFEVNVMDQCIATSILNRATLCMCVFLCMVCMWCVYVCVCMCRGCCVLHTCVYACVVYGYVCV